VYGSAALNKTSTLGHAGPLLDRAEGHDIVDCVPCGFAHAWPLPTQDELQVAYAQHYYAAEKPDYLARAEADAPWAQAFYADRLGALNLALGERAASHPRLLDIGSGPGHFLAHAESRGWRAEGIEPSKQASAYAASRGLKIHNRFFDAAWAKAQRPFDAIHAMNVAEHVPDPAALLTAAHGLLKPGGALCVGVPNDYSPMQHAARNAGAKPWWLVPPHHLNYFSFDTLERLLVKCGFKPLERLTSFPMEAFLLMGRNYVGDDEAGRALHAERKAFDANLEAMDPQIRRRFYRALASKGFGREAIVVAVKS
jgi:SAM-dependent methyltransferase